MTRRLVGWVAVSAALHGGVLASPLAIRRDPLRAIAVELAPPAPVPEAAKVRRAERPARRAPAEPAPPPVIPAAPDLPPAADRGSTVAVGAGGVELPDRTRPTPVAHAPERSSADPPDTVGGSAMSRTVAQPRDLRAAAPIATAPLHPPPSRARAGETDDPPIGRILAPAANRPLVTAADATKALPSLLIGPIPSPRVGGRGVDPEAPPRIGGAEPPGSVRSSVVARLLGTSGVATAPRQQAAGGSAAGAAAERAGDSKPAPSRATAGVDSGDAKPGQDRTTGGATPGDIEAVRAGASTAPVRGSGPESTARRAGSQRDRAPREVVPAPRVPSARPPSQAGKAAAAGERGEGGEGGTGARADGAGLSARAVTGSTGAGEATAEYLPYLQRLRSQIQETIKYPAAARRRGLAGTVRVEIVVRPSGEIESVTLLGSSTHDVLDNTVLEAVRALRPRPFPADLPRRPVRVQLPIVFDFR